jgi:hypothetical protein
MYRIRLDRLLSDIVNLTRAKDALRGLSAVQLGLSASSAIFTAAIQAGTTDKTTIAIRRHISIPVVSPSPFCRNVFACDVATRDAGIVLAVEYAAGFTLGSAGVAPVELTRPGRAPS